MNARYHRALLQTAGLLAAAAFSLAAAAGSAGQPGDKRLEGLVAAERAFAAMSRDRGAREAFLAYLADDAVVFRPKPVPGRKIYEEMAASSEVILTWTPAYAEIAARGDLGYTAGPYEIRDRSKPAAPPRFGHYVSIWERQPTGEWKVSLDAGISHAEPGRAPELVATLPPGFRGWRGPAVDRDTERAALLEVEAAFSRKARGEGLPEAYLACAAEDVRLYRDRELPMAGKAALLKFISGDSRKFAWRPVDAVVSATGDLGYVFGDAEAVGGRSLGFEWTSYLRIWRKTAGGDWRMALDLAVPVPPETVKNK